LDQRAEAFVGSRSSNDFSPTSPRKPSKMSRPQIAALSCVPVLCVTAWLVHLQGRVYRQALRETRQANLTSRLVETDQTRAPATAASAASSVSPAILSSSTSARQGNPADAETEHTRPAALARTTGPSESSAPHSHSLPSPAEAPSPASVAATSPSARTFDVPKDLMSMSREDEDRAARALDQIILGKHRTIDDAGLRHRLNEAIRPLLTARRRKEIEYRYQVLDSPRVSAFSHLGGYIYINRGVLDLAANEAELQFVLAREIAHIDERDCAKSLTRSDGTAKSGDVSPLARIYRRIAAGLPAEMEFQADALAYRQLIRLGRSRYQALGFLRRYLKHVEERQPLEDANAIPDVRGDLDAQIENHWRTLPSAVDRLERLRALAEP
jgi:Peptidase family M48